MPTNEDRAFIDQRAQELTDEQKETDTVTGLHDPRASAAAMMALFKLFEEHDVEEVAVDVVADWQERDFELGLLMTKTGFVFRRVPKKTH